MPVAGLDEILRAINIPTIGVRKVAAAKDSKKLLEIFWQAASDRSFYARNLLSA
jgi:hypothetical protein